MTIISVHLPKTAGTSFGVSLAMHFGDRLKYDNGDQAICKSPVERWQQTIAAGLAMAEQDLEKIECVHGHFLPAKYLPLGQNRALTFVTWMREPVARMFSHYHYWRHSYDEATAAPHHRQMIEEDWSLERFCFSGEFRNIYTQYLWRFPIEKFSFVGICEYFQQELDEFSSRYLSTKLPHQHHNATPRTASIAELDEGFLKAVRDFHAADVALYAKALRLRRIRLDMAKDRMRFGTGAELRHAVG
ncbi:hypothetical protein [Rhodanobacter sp. L36]|uniref:hypothetical protein n=1 Tax=Rhodanobacter sp. L36 TaxID=1747221 RepID=UPI00131D2A12|nr:hypothetical protein [Rhodanobacter sp. L36]